MTSYNESSSSFRELYSSFLKRVPKWDETFTKALNDTCTEEVVRKLQPAKTCLSIGPSTGVADIKFIEHFMPNLRALTAVEPDSSAAEELKRNLEHHLPNVDTAIILPKTCQEFLQSAVNVDAGDMAEATTYDVVLLFNVLYHVGDTDRMILFEKLRDGLLSPGGSIVIQHVQRTDRLDEFQRLVEQLTPRQDMLLTDTIIGELLASGFQIYHRNECCYELDFSGDPDDGLIHFFSENIAFRQLSAEEFRDAVSRVQPTGWFTSHDAILLLERL